MNPPDSGKPSNAQSALLDYYDDVLGSLSSDPLEQLENEDREAQSKLPSRNNTKKTYQVGLAKTHKKTVKKKAAAKKAARAVNGFYCVPTINNNPNQKCDFNDLFVTEGSQAVIGQVKELKL